MELTFEYELLSEKDSIIALAQEPDALFTKFFISSGRLSNEATKVDGGVFSDLGFRHTPRLITAQPVVDFGIKAFPHIGAYGFYTPKYRQTSIAVVPIYRDNVLYPAPIVTLTDTGTMIQVSISNEEDVAYECYRIVIRHDDLAAEFVTYNTEFDFMPMFDGECFITVRGHTNEISVTSDAFETDMVLEKRTTDFYSGYVRSVDGMLPDVTGDVALSSGGFVKSVDNTIPDEAGNVTLSGLVKSVDNVTPDEEGNITLSGLVKSVDNNVPDQTGNVDLSSSGYVKGINELQPNEVGIITLNAEDIPFEDEDFEALEVKGAVKEAKAEATVGNITVILAASDWTSGTQIIAAPGVTATNTVIVAPAPAAQATYVAAGIICTEQADGLLTFTCTAEPVTNISVGVVIL
jgi:hypothetical protein